MILGGLQRTSTIDFPGCLSCVVFTRGCDLDCFYCHNRELIVSGGGTISQEEVLAFLEKRRGLLDGVVVSGGEPTLQKDLPDFLRQVKGMGYRVKLDTNGRDPSLVESLCREGLVDYAAVDVKALPEDYPAVCGGEGFGGAARTLAVLADLGIPHEARTTLYPGFALDQLEKLLGLLPVQPRWRLNYFRMPETFRSQDGPRLELPALVASAAAGEKERLLALQPNLIL